MTVVSGGVWGFGEIFPPQVPGSKSKTQQSYKQLQSSIRKTDSTVGNKEQAGDNDTGQGRYQQFFDMAPVWFPSIENDPNYVHDAQQRKHKGDR